MMKNPDSMPRVPRVPASNRNNTGTIHANEQFKLL